MKHVQRHHHRAFGAFSLGPEPVHPGKIHKNKIYISIIHSEESLRQIAQPTCCIFGLGAAGALARRNAQRSSLAAQLPAEEEDGVFGSGDNLLLRPAPPRRHKVPLRQNTS